MIVRDLVSISGTEREVDWGNGMSRRFLLHRDGMGFSLTDTLVRSGSRSLLQYRNHMEACYCISGSGEVQNVETGEVHDLRPGTMYALDLHDSHYLIAKEDMRLVCVFSPPLQGDERHSLSNDSESSY